MPVVPLRLHGYVLPLSTDPRWRQTPEAIGVGPEGSAWALWRPVEPGTGALVTRHSGGTEITSSRELLRAPADTQHFIQPLPDGRVLTASARSTGQPSGHCWGDTGALETEADLGDAVQHVLSDDSGAVWVSYFDEAMGAPPPAGRGLARFSKNLSVEWMYPSSDSENLPPIYDCYSLNVHGTNAFCCAYDEFELVRLEGGNVENLGPLPSVGADGLLITDDVGVAIGGYGPDDDLVSPFRITSSGVEVVGSPSRIALPDGRRVRDRTIFCRGGELHVFVQTAWYRLDLDELLGRPN